MLDINNNTLTNEEKESILAILSSVIAIPSVKGNEAPNAPYGIHTVQALEYMLELGRENGFTVKNLDGRVGYIEWGAGDKILGLLCHLDVVPAGDGWSHDPFTLRRENGWLIGRGINDDKGPAVTIFFAMLRLKKAGFNPACRIRLILGLDEECGSSCIEHYKAIEELPTCGFTPDADFPAIFAEKGILQILVSGPLTSKITVSAGERPNMVPARCSILFTDSDKKIEGTGITAHASKPQLGKNAIYEALKQMESSDLSTEPLLSFFMDKIGNDTTGKFLLPELPGDISGVLTLNAGVLELDNNKSELTIDIRYPVLADPDNILTVIRTITAEYGLKTEIISHQKPLFLDPKKPLIQTLLTVYEKFVELAPFDAATDSDVRLESLKKPSVPQTTGGGTYARSMPGLVAFGPSFPWDKDQAHQIDEAVQEEAIYILVQIYQDAIAALSINIDMMP